MLRRQLFQLCLGTRRDGPPDAADRGISVVGEQSPLAPGPQLGQQELEEGQSAGLTPNVFEDAIDQPVLETKADLRRRLGDGALQLLSPHRAEVDHGVLQAIGENAVFERSAVEVAAQGKHNGHRPVRRRL